MDSNMSGTRRQEAVQDEEQVHDDCDGGSKNKSHVSRNQRWFVDPARRIQNWSLFYSRLHSDRINRSSGSATERNAKGRTGGICTTKTLARGDEAPGALEGETVQGTVDNLGAGIQGSSSLVR